MMQWELPRGPKPGLVDLVGELSLIPGGKGSCSSVVSRKWVKIGSQS